MKNDFDMIVHKFSNEIKIKVIADLHYGSQEFDMKAWKKEKQYIIDNDIHIIIDGDLIDNGVKTGKGLGLYEQTCRPREQKEWLINEMRELKHLILCVTPGNHEYRNNFVDDEPLYDMCRILQIEHLYRPCACFMKIQIGEREETHSRQAYTFLVTHGKSKRKNENFGGYVDGVDVFVYGHTHEPELKPKSKILVDNKNNKVTTKKYWKVVATSWLKYGGYALRAQYNPTANMDLEFKLCKGREKELKFKVR